jgi:hypothetical protein
MFLTFAPLLCLRNVVINVSNLICGLCLKNFNICFYPLWFGHNYIWNVCVFRTLLISDNTDWVTYQTDFVEILRNLKFTYRQNSS